MSASRPIYLRDEVERDCIAALEARGSDISKLYDHQLDAIIRLLSGERVIQRIQTGGGKTLVIELSIILPKDYPSKYPGPLLTLVFTPTRILLEDTLRRFRKYGIVTWASPAMDPGSIILDPTTCASAIPEPDQDILRKINEADVILTNIEFWNTPSPKSGAARLAFHDASLKLIWIDECDSAMKDSKTYRPSQLHLSKIPTMYPGTALLLSSATMTVRLMREGINWYNIPDAIQVMGPADRENLLITRMNATDMPTARSIIASNIQELLRFVAKNPKKRHDQAIVFVRSCNDIETMVTYLRRTTSNFFGPDFDSSIIQGLHANMSGKQDILHRVASRKIRVLVPTLASCAAGLDFPDIRLIFILTIPDSIEQLWQALGRAGRDGNKAKIVLYSSLDDNVKAMGNSKHPFSTRIMLRTFGGSKSCRLMEILNYIDGSNSSKCGHCDLCLKPQAWALLDVSDGVHEFLQFIGPDSAKDYRLILTSSTPTIKHEVIQASLELGLISVLRVENAINRYSISVSPDDKTQSLFLSRGQVLIHQARAMELPDQKRTRTV